MSVLIEPIDVEPVRRPQYFWFKRVHWIAWSEFMMNWYYWCEWNKPISLTYLYCFEDEGLNFTVRSFSSVVAHIMQTNFKILSTS